MVAYFFLRKKSLWSLLIRVWSIIVFRSLIAIGRLLGYGRLFLLPKNGIVLSIFVPLIAVNICLPLEVKIHQTESLVLKMLMKQFCHNWTYSASFLGIPSYVVWHFIQWNFYKGCTVPNIFSHFQTLIFAHF